MTANLTIVMYHYVRDFARSRFAKIKGLDVVEFRAQLDHLQKTFSLIGYEDIRAHCMEDVPLPPNSCWLTFDDGYKDHHDFVLPELQKRRLTASFFPPARVVEEHALLLVNKIHYILASVDDAAILVAELRTSIESGIRHGKSLHSFEVYWEEHAKPGRYDGAEVMFVKRMLQHALPFTFRNQVVTDLFKKHVSSDEAEFSAELYMSKDHLREMIDAGMHIGSHGYEHMWLNQADAAAQAIDIDKSLAFLDSIGARNPKDWVMCYPYGGYNEDTLELLRARGCLLGLTTLPATASLRPDSLLKLPRWDTNDFPRS